MKMLTPSPKRTTSSERGNSKQLLLLSEKLADDIATARLAPGRRFSIKSLAQWLRTTSETAEIILPAFLDSNMVARDGQDVIIASVDRTGLLPRLDSRLPLEQLIARNASTKATPEQIANMRENTAHMKRCATIGDIDGYMRADRQLEQIIGSASQLPDQLEQLALMKREFRRAWLAYNRLRDLSEPAGLRHNLVESIAANNPEKAEKAVAAFIDYLRRSF
jgi:DNA-binding GntR family transcriptional regulator